MQPQCPKTDLNIFAEQSVPGHIQELPFVNPF